RTEDPRLLTGTARYVADLRDELGGPPLYAYFVRSEIPHGRIDAIHADDARAVPGVAAVFTAGDLGLAPHHRFVNVHDHFVRYPLAVDRVRFVGDAMAVVLGESYAAAEDAVQLEWADIEPLPALVDPESALAPDAEPLFPDHGGNLALSESADAPIDLADGSDVVARGRYVNQRVNVAPMAPHGFAAAPAPDGRLRVWPSNQLPHGVWGALSQALGVERAQIHVVTPQVGGGFGGK